MVNLTPGQKDSISTEAAAFLENVRHAPFASLLSPFIASPGRIPGIRQTITQKLLPIEEQHIQNFKLTVTETTIANVPVVIIEPPRIAPRNESKILLNIYGGGFVMGTA